MLAGLDGHWKGGVEVGGPFRLGMGWWFAAQSFVRIKIPTQSPFGDTQHCGRLMENISKMNGGTRETERV